MREDTPRDKGVEPGGNALLANGSLLRRQQQRYPFAYKHNQKRTTRKENNAVVNG